MLRTAIVTGGATGIGKAISSLLCNEGYNVIIGYNSSYESAKKLEKDLTSKGFSASSFKVDVTDAESIKNLFQYCIKTFGKIDLLVNNAGIAHQKLLTDITDDDWNKMITTNLTGCFKCCREAARYMIKEHSGNIINISSMWGVVGASCESHYSASKAGIIGLTKSLAKELGPSNIRVNCIAPGVIMTDMLKSFSEDDLNSLKEETPLCRLGTPEDIANAVSFLASDKASFITGQVLNVDGGFVI